MFNKAVASRQSRPAGLLPAVFLTAALLVAVIVVAGLARPAAAHGGGEPDHQHEHELRLEALNAPSDGRPAIELTVITTGSEGAELGFSLGYFRYREDSGVECDSRYRGLGAASWQDLGLTETEWNQQRDVFRSGSIIVFKAEPEDEERQLYRYTHTVAEPLIALDENDLRPFADNTERMQFCFLLHDNASQRELELDFNLQLGGFTGQPAAPAAEDEEEPADETADGGQTPEPETVETAPGTEESAEGNPAIIIGAVVGGLLFAVTIVAVIIVVIAGAKNSGSSGSGPAQPPAA